MAPLNDRRPLRHPSTGFGRHTRAAIVILALVLGAAWIVPTVETARPEEAAAVPVPEPATLASAAYFSALDAALVDRLPVKSLAVRSIGTAFNVMGLSPSSAVLRGGGGMPYYTLDFTAPCWQRPLAESTLDTIVSSGDLLESNGTGFVFYVPPTKARALPAGLGPLAGPIMECADAGAAVLNAEAERPGSPVFMDWEATIDGDVASFYYPDTHWTSSAALRGVGLLFDHLVADGYAPAGMWAPAVLQPRAPETRDADLFRLMGVKVPFEVVYVEAVRPEVASVQVQDTSANAERTQDILRQWTSSSDGAPLVRGRTLFLHDSYAGWMLPAMIPYFENLTEMHYDNPAALDPGFLAGFDLVILEKVERAALDPAWAFRFTEAVTTGTPPGT